MSQDGENPPEFIYFVNCVVKSVPSAVIAGLMYRFGSFPESCQYDISLYQLLMFTCFHISVFTLGVVDLRDPTSNYTSSGHHQHNNPVTVTNPPSGIRNLVNPFPFQVLQYVRSEERRVG